MPQAWRLGLGENAGVAYDERLAERIRDLFAREPGVSEMRMFGGLAFLIEGNMAVAASERGGLMVRIAPEETAALLDEPHAGPFEMRGRAMDGWLRVDDAGLRTDAELGKWVDRGITFARSLPPKAD